MPEPQNTAHPRNDLFSRGEPHRADYPDGRGGTDWASYQVDVDAYHRLAYGTLGDDRPAQHRVAM
jgi:hypothetical protein